MTRKLTLWFGGKVTYHWFDMPIGAIERCVKISYSKIVKFQDISIDMEGNVWFGSYVGGRVRTTRAEPPVDAHVMTEVDHL